jgi:hypothetical protein
VDSLRAYDSWSNDQTCRPLGIRLRISPVESIELQALSLERSDMLVATALVADGAGLQHNGREEGNDLDGLSETNWSGRDECRVERQEEGEKEKERELKEERTPYRPEGERKWEDKLSEVRRSYEDVMTVSYAQDPSLSVAVPLPKELHALDLVRS